LNVTETVEREFSSELSQFSTVIFANDLKIEPKVTCPELEIGLIMAIKNQSRLNDAIELSIPNQKEFRVQRKMNASTCLKYEIRSFVKMAQNVELIYKFQLEVNGEMGSEVMGANAMQGSFEVFEQQG